VKPGTPICNNYITTPEEKVEFEEPYAIGQPVLLSEIINQFPVGVHNS